GRPREHSLARRVTAQATRSAQEGHRRTPGLDALGLAPEQAVHWNLRPAALYEHAARRGEGVITEGGAFCAVTSPHTGRSPNDKFIGRFTRPHHTSASDAADDGRAFRAAARGRGAPPQQAGAVRARP